MESKNMGLNVITAATGVVVASGDMQYSNIAVAGAVTVYTKAIEVSKAEFFGLFYKANSVLAGVDLKIELQTSFILPVTEGSADDYWSEPVNQPDIVASLTTEDTIYHQSLSVPPCKYLRFKITGAAGNAADCILNMWLVKQE